MVRFNNPLEQVRVAAPCNADWEQMIGNERARFCGQCNLNVYNLSSMTRSEAETLIARNEGRLCVRFYRRKDGSIITENCPVGLRAIKRKLAYVRKAVASAVIGFFAGLGIQAAFSSVVPLEPQRTMGVMAIDVDHPHVTTNVGPVVVRPYPEIGQVTVGRLAPIGRRPRNRNPLTSHR